MSNSIFVVYILMDDMDASPEVLCFVQTKERADALVNTVGELLSHFNTTLGDINQEMLELDPTRRRWSKLDNKSDKIARGVIEKINNIVGIKGICSLCTLFSYGVAYYEVMECAL